MTEAEKLTAERREAAQRKAVRVMAYQTALQAIAAKLCEEVYGGEKRAPAPRFELNPGDPDPMFGPAEDVRKAALEFTAASARHRGEIVASTQDAQEIAAIIEQEWEPLFDALAEKMQDFGRRVYE